ncbi:RNA pyrophosphohydrolase [Thiotrichales bacterium 19S11-10]|nr:RNA pyrophosphohydrolase [Thiotrichales bacterium 19S11-10]
MIDHEGFRANVAIVLINKEGKVFWGKRLRQNAWQFPQGGLNSGETPLEALYRELYEEVGLKPHDVEVIAATKSWLRYRLPRFLIRRGFPLCIGQKQKWFLLRLKSDDSAINLEANNKPEFDAFRWVDYWYPTSRVVSFKRHVYRKALEYFFPIYKEWR